MKYLLASVSAFVLLAAPALAQTSTSDSKATARAAALASGGFSGGNSMTNNFAGAKVPHNTPDVAAPFVSAAGTECQLPGVSLGGAFVGTGAALGLPGGPDEACQAMRMAEFYMKVSLSSRDPREAREYRQTAIDLTCQVPRMQRLAVCASRVAPVAVAVGYAQPAGATWYCRDPAGYYPTIPSCMRWESVAAR